MSLPLNRELLYPNPASSTIRVQIVLDASSDVTFKIYDVTGRVMLLEEQTLDIGEQNIEFDIEALPGGTYLMELSDGENQVQKQFIKQ
jgi:hypothetical protein